MRGPHGSGGFRTISPFGSLGCGRVQTFLRIFFGTSAPHRPVSLPRVLVDAIELSGRVPPLLVLVSSIPHGRSEAERLVARKGAGAEEERSACQTDQMVRKRSKEMHAIVPFLGCKWTKMHAVQVPRARIFKKQRSPRQGHEGKGHERGASK